MKRDMIIGVNFKVQILKGFLLFLLLLSINSAMAEAGKATPKPLVLKPESFHHYIDKFNQHDNELYVQCVPNAGVWDFIKNNVPLLDCPDKDIEEIYYFRWWTYRKAIKKTPEGFVLSEFLPAVGWAGKYNTISCAAGHHLREGRWLFDPQYLDDYSLFWFRKGGSVRRYSFPAADAIWACAQVTGDVSIAKELLPDLIKNYENWEGDHQDANGLFWQIDDRDGMEVSIGGSGYRATINSYQYGDALAIGQIATLAGQTDFAVIYRDKAAKLKQLVESKLWDDEAKFYKVLPRGEGKKLVDVREEHGFTPWYFNLPDPDKSAAWKQLMDPKGFYAPYGPTTAEQRHPRFAIAYKDHECQWNGPSWPFATSVTLTGLANLLNNYRQKFISRKDYLEILKIYTKSHRLKLDDGRVVPWIDENINPTNGDWISRTRLKNWKNGTWDAGKGGEERGKDYNHSTYCDLVISGLIGLRPRADDTVEVNPLVPDDTWDYFCLDQVLYHGHWLTILYDKTGEHYKKGKGLRIFADGKEIGAAEKLTRLTAQLPSAQPLPKLLGNRFLTFTSVIRVRQIETTRDSAEGPDETSIHSPVIAQAFRDTIEQSWPGARITWAFSWLALNDQRQVYKALRDLVVSFHYKYGDEITFIPGGYFANMYSSREQVNRDLHDALKMVSDMVGKGYRPRSVVAGFLAAENLRYLSEEEGIHVCQGNIWSQYAIDNGDGNGSISYPYYPSREHFLKAAQSSADQIDCVNLDGWTCDFLTARRAGFANGFNSRLGVGPIETLISYGVEKGVQEMMATTAAHFDEGLKLNKFGWVTNICELGLVEAHTIYNYSNRGVVLPGLASWLKGIRSRWPDAKAVTVGEFGSAWREQFRNNDKIDYRFVQRGSGFPGSEPNMEIRWFMNKDFRLGLLRDWKANSPEQVIDFTRYDLKAQEPLDPKPGEHARNWSLMNRMNQKGLRPEDKPVPMTELSAEEQAMIKRRYPELITGKSEKKN